MATQTSASLFSLALTQEGPRAIPSRVAAAIIASTTWDAWLIAGGALSLVLYRIAFPPPPEGPWTPKLDMVLVLRLLAAAGATAFLAVKMRHALRRLALLRRGTVTYAVIHECLPHAPGSAFDVVRLSYEVAGVRYGRTVKVPREVSRRITDDEAEPLVYASTDPALAFMLDELGVEPRVGPGGEVTLRRPAFAGFKVAAIVGVILFLTLATVVTAVG